MSKITKIIASFFGLGFLPAIPGTFGSLAGLLIYWLVKDNTVYYSVTIIIIFIIGCFFSGKAERLYKKPDPGVIVIDEVCGMLVALFLIPHRIILVVSGFVIFRLFDIIKFPPAQLIEKRGGAIGIMGDDILSAVYTNAILRIIYFIFFISR